MSGNRVKKGQLVCLLCRAPLVESTAAGLWLHPESTICQVRVTDADGLSLDEQYEVVDDVIYERETPTTPTTAMTLFGLPE